MRPPGVLDYRLDMIRSYRASAYESRSNGLPLRRARQAAEAAYPQARQVRRPRSACRLVKFGGTSRCPRGQCVRFRFGSVPSRTRSRLFSECVPHRRFDNSSLARPLRPWSAHMPGGRGPTKASSTRWATSRGALPMATVCRPSLRYLPVVRMRPATERVAPLPHRTLRGMDRTRPRLDTSYPSCPRTGRHSSGSAMAASYYLDKLCIYH